MKLRNKKTGEIGEPNTIRHDGTVFVVTKIGMPYCKESILGKYRSLAELNEEWEDYEEPKPQVVYYIDRDGDIVSYKNVEYPKRVFNTEQNKEIGNYFETKEEAEKAVEKLKAWKRLKDKGFRFDPVDRYKALCGNGFNIPITATMPPEAYTDVEVSKDLDICFGGEE